MQKPCLHIQSCWRYAGCKFVMLASHDELSHQLGTLGYVEGLLRLLVQQDLVFRNGLLEATLLLEAFCKEMTRLTQSGGKHQAISQGCFGRNCSA